MQWHPNTACRFCDGARPPWASKAAAGAETTEEPKNAATSKGKGKGTSKGKGKGKGKHLGKGAGKGQRPEKLDDAIWGAQQRATHRHRPFHDARFCC